METNEQDDQIVNESGAAAEDTQASGSSDSSKGTDSRHDALNPMFAVIGDPGKMPDPETAQRIMLGRSVEKGLPVSEPALVASNTVPAPASITELARALKNDVDLIYEWVYSNIDLFPMAGIHKGALGTLIDRVGGSLEQASLMIELLRVSGYTATHVLGTIRLTKAQIEQLLDTQGTPVASASSDILTHGGIAHTAVYDGQGELTYIDMDHAWVKVDIGGTNYVFDPAFKSYLYSSGIDLSSVIGYDEATLINDSQSGATITADYIQNLNATGIRNKFKDSEAVNNNERLLAQNLVK